MRTHLTPNDVETIRIHLSAVKERLCNQCRWKEAQEYQDLIDRLLTSVSSDENDPTLYGYSIRDLSFLAAILQKDHISPTELTAILHDVTRMTRIVITDISDTIQRAIDKQMENRL